ncbi:MAG: Cytochrome c-type biogenesis protein CcdA (DsbD analog), partial [uncultured Thermomicrobiales bacterium]
ARTGQSGDGVPGRVTVVLLALYSTTCAALPRASGRADARPIGGARGGEARAAAAQRGRLCPRLLARLRGPLRPAGRFPGEPPARPPGSSTAYWRRLPDRARSQLPGPAPYPSTAARVAFPPRSRARRPLADLAPRRRDLRARLDPLRRGDPRGDHGDGGHQWEQWGRTRVAGRLLARPRPPLHGRRRRIRARRSGAAAGQPAPPRAQPPLRRPDRGRRRRDAGRRLPELLRPTHPSHPLDPAAV